MALDTPTRPTADDADLCRCGHDGYDDHDMRETPPGCIHGCDPDRCDGIVRASTIAHELARAYPTATIDVEQTGGGTATVYVNPRDPSGVGDDFGYDLAVGPGSYDYANRWRSVFLWEELSIGAADEGHPVGSLDDLRAYLDSMKAGTTR